MAESSGHRACVVVPCFNETSRLPTQSFSNFFSKLSSTCPSPLLLLLLDDGSSDRTSTLLQSIASSCPSHVCLLTSRSPRPHCAGNQRCFSHPHRRLKLSHSPATPAKLKLSVTACAAPSPAAVLSSATGTVIYPPRLRPSPTFSCALFVHPCVLSGLSTEA